MQQVNELAVQKGELIMNNPRKPWIAGILTFFAIGLGHLYSGNIKRGISLYVVWQALLVLIFFSYLFYAPIGPIIVIIAGISYLIYCIVDSIKYAIMHKQSYSMKKYNKWYVYLLYFFIASVVIQTIVETSAKSNIAQAYKIPSGAMMQTLQIGDHIITDKFIYKISEPEQGDIVVFPFPEDPSKDFIKRIVGVGGDVLEIKNKQVFINGTPYLEAYKIHNDTNMFPHNVQPRDNYGPIKIPEDSLFVMGDNRDQSADSRYWGFVKKSSIIGKAKSIYWSWDKENFKVRWNRIGKKVE